MENDGVDCLGEMKPIRFFFGTGEGVKTFAEYYDMWSKCAISFQDYELKKLADKLSESKRLNDAMDLTAAIQGLWPERPNIMQTDLEVFAFIYKQWADQTFPENVGNPLPSLHHLKEEVEEVLQAPGDIMEYADCFMLLLNALMNAGFTVNDLLYASWAKLSENQKREWIGPLENGNYKHKKKEDE